jgi:hypothetical protein
LGNSNGSPTAVVLCGCSGVGKTRMVSYDIARLYL